MSLKQQVTSEFERQFGTKPTYVVRAPGRVNLIGEHTDYNDGFVLPMTIDRAVWIALKRDDNGVMLIHSSDFEQTAEFTLDGMKDMFEDWREYIKGVAWALREAGYDLETWDGVIMGDVPVGAGLSSSAAVEMATARAFAAVSGFQWDAPRMALIGQKAENEWVGVPCGIMDQMISAAGEAGHALLIDCRSLATESVPLPPGTVVVVLDSMTRRELGDTPYKERRQSCEAAANHFGIKALRDISVHDFEKRAHELDEVTRRRARHVVTENERTLQAAKAMRAGSAEEMGELMNDSHISMRDDFEITRPEIDALVACAQSHPACYGARMTGGGFGGCAVALVRTEAVDSFVSSVTECYTSSLATMGFEPLEANIYVCTPTNGAEIV